MGQQAPINNGDCDCGKYSGSGQQIANIPGQPVPQFGPGPAQHFKDPNLTGGFQPVGVAALHIQGPYASLAFAGTLPDYRSLGAQQLLMNVRLEAARAAGCRYLIAETAEPTPEKSVTSYNNMHRFGVQDMYPRANWIFPA